MAADLRVVLEVHATDPTNSATLIVPSTVLYDGVIGNVSGFCTYALVNSLNLNCTIPFTRMLQPVDAEVRSARPGESYRTRLVGSQTEGAECIILSSSAVQFFPSPGDVNIPAASSSKASAAFSQSAEVRGDGVCTRRTNPRTPSSLPFCCAAMRAGSVTRAIARPSPRYCTSISSFAVGILTSPGDGKNCTAEVDRMMHSAPSVWEPTSRVR